MPWKYFWINRGSSNAHIARAAIDSIAYQTYDVLKQWKQMQEYQLLN
jgi:glycerol kinase